MTHEEEIELAWAAGFFDGEGSFNEVKHEGNASTLQMSLGQSGNGEVPYTLMRFLAAVDNAGKLYGPYKAANPQHLDQWKWRAHGDEARKVFYELEPYLSDMKTAKFYQVTGKCA